jgi:hypothetical protein
VTFTIRKALVALLILLICSFLIPVVVKAQPQPPDVDTLGPVVFFSQSGNVTILSPKNLTNYVNPIQLNFTVEAKGLFGQFGNVGVSLDEGIINSVTDFINKTVIQSDVGLYWYQTTVLASIMLPTLSEGTHNVTVYYGWQYLGIPENPSLQRYEVFGHSTVDFMVVSTNIPPSISILSPQNTTYNSTIIPLNFTVNHPVNQQVKQMSYSLDGRKNIPITGNTTITYVSNGHHNLIVYATDETGNTGASEVLYFKVEESNPFPMPYVVAAVIVALIVISAGLIIYFKKCKR